ncbi:hypothetical protein [Tenacibaculum dicentrarchi]|uniref:hypothetical protein n=1 Tax=Tenacibaculum dicentrarchi TaxID=669041 RepID=UPI000CB3AA5E|nr:conserved hypothetical protein [Tenacibaculum dicentrarchi]
MKNLEGFGVQELNTKEIKEANGGGAWVPFVVLGIYLYDNRDRFAEGFSSAFN